MQINGTSQGSAMAASEPPEPPPRNPDRINASLHKINESKSLKILEEKIASNHKPLKPVLLLDTANSTTTNVNNSGINTTTTTTTTIIATTTTLTGAAVGVGALSSPVVNKTNVTSLASPSAGVLLFSKQKQQQHIINSDITSGGGGGENISTQSTNVSNHALISPMTVDNQLQTQQRLNFQHQLKSDVNSSSTSTATTIGFQQLYNNITTPTPLQTTTTTTTATTSQPGTYLMTQQQNGGTRNTTCLGGSLIDHHHHQNQPQQSNHLMNGSSNGGNVSNGSATSSGSSSSASASASGSSNNSNHSNSLSGSNTLNSNATPTTLVDKGNANNYNNNNNNNNHNNSNNNNNNNNIACSFDQLMNFRYSFGPYVDCQEDMATISTKYCEPKVVVATVNTATTTINPTAALYSKSKKAISSSNSSSSNHFHSNRYNDTTTATATATTKFNYGSESSAKLREENERLNAEIQRLRKLLENSPEGAVGGIDLSDTNSCGDDSTVTNLQQQRVERLEQELRSVRTQLMTLRLDRKKLRFEKNELLSQIKQLCCSLQEKEQELRDFIRNYQDRVRETDANHAKMTGDRERERWQLLKQARDEAERSLALAQQLSARDIQLQRLQDQLQEARRQISGCLSDQESLLSFAPLTPPSANSVLLSQMPNANVATNNFRNDDSGRGNSNSLSAFSSSSGNTTADRNSCSNDSVLRNNSDRESTGGDINFSDGACDNGPCITVDPDSISLVSSQNMYQYGTPKEHSPTLSPLNTAAYSRSVEQLGSPVESDGTGAGAGAIVRKYTPKPAIALQARNGRVGGGGGGGGTWGSISRVFARSRNKNKALSADGITEFADYSWSPLSEEGYAEKLRLLREASTIPMERWRASQVLAWLEVALGMPQYSTRCAENVKSGKVLLELNDVELESGLGLNHPMHRKKLRLAIEEQRRPELVRYPMITQLGHTWVASEWLPDIGLPQYAESFVHSMVDARMLDTLSKKELEKFLGVTRKFHQASIVHGIHVLRIVKYDRQTLAMRRVQSETVDTDPIVWTNQRFIRWARSIDLSEYADNLKDSGVHGGLVVLEPSFSGDTMATALGVPPSKNIIRRHLSTEFDALILPARATLGQGIRSGCGIVPITGPGGLQHYATTDRRSSGSLRISPWKGSQSSLSKAFRFNAKQSRSGSSIGDRTSIGNSTSPTPSFSSSEGGSGGIYATIGPQFIHYPPPTTAPPPPPSTSVLPTTPAPLPTNSFSTHSMQYPYYGQTAIVGHRISAPPTGSNSMDSTCDINALSDQHRRVKSISDIGRSASASAAVSCLGTQLLFDQNISKTVNNAKCSGSNSSGSGGGGDGGFKVAKSPV